MDLDNRISITVCGDGGCGKSSITLRLVRSQWTSEYDPTIEDSYSVTRTIDGQAYHLQLTDTAGQEEYRSLWAASNLRSDAFLLVYDITNSASLDALTYFHDMIAMEEDTRADASAVAPVKLVAGNKCDLQSQRVVRSVQGLEWARARGCGFMETSARDMVNIEETFALLVRRVVEARRIHAGGDASMAQATHTQPLPPLTEKPVTSITAAKLAARSRANQPSWWRRLKCW
ncbi:ras-domain-containing protein [Microthyrium microscopicum]|uniref:Ras-domain-containing protein n=1 Tax=Microthyrium microscopicum TaxID=703497 RepID=A0A6A6TU62_9PEZI|nr:ras-domain-containing protein [Microthyrium microscopicum]